MAQVGGKEMLEVSPGVFLPARHFVCVNDGYAWVFLGSKFVGGFPLDSPVGKIIGVDGWNRRRMLESGGSEFDPPATPDNTGQVYPLLPKKSHTNRVHRAVD